MGVWKNLSEFIWLDRAITKSLKEKCGRCGIESDQKEWKVACPGSYAFQCPNCDNRLLVQDGM